MINFCTNCGNRVGENDNFCINCGTQIRDKPITKKEIGFTKVTSDRVIVYTKDLRKYDAFASSLKLKYIIYKVKFGTKHNEIKDIIKNQEYNYKQDLYYFLKDTNLYYLSPKTPNTFSRFYDFSLNKEMKKDKKELMYLFSIADVQNPINTQVINFDTEKTFILRNKVAEDLFKKD